jgi:hypothetical protein
MKNSIASLIMVAAIVILASCSKSGDPAPATQAQKTALDSVKAAMTGVWKFTSVTVAQISPSKSATTSTCGKAELAAAGFANTNWKNFTGEPNFTYTGSDSKATIDYPCLSGDPTDAVTFVITQVSSEMFNIEFNDIGTTDIMTFQIKSSDVKTANIKATLISTGSVNMSGYNVTYQFTKQ